MDRRAVQQEVASRDAYLAEAECHGRQRIERFARIGRQGQRRCVTVLRRVGVPQLRLVGDDPVWSHERVAFGSQRTRGHQQRQFVFNSRLQLARQIHLAAGIPQFAACDTIHESSHV